MIILVTDGENRAALAATRSLGRKGHRILVGERHSPCLASVSKYCSTGFRYPDPSRDSAGFVKTVAETAERERVDVVLPMAEISTLLIAENRSLFEPTCRVPFTNFAMLDLASDKCRLIELAGSLGVPVPKSEVLEKPFIPAGFLARHKFPLVLKPCRSRIRFGSGYISTGVSYARDATELEMQIAGKSPAEFPVLVQELIRGAGVGVFVLYEHGVPLTYFSHRRLREKPPSGGVSVLRESIPVPAALKDYSERIMRRLAWHGVAMVEFKQDDRDGIPKLMEINARFWGSLQLAIDAGVDFPDLLVKLAMGQGPLLVPSYKFGVRTRWLWGDIDALLMSLRGAGRPPRSGCPRPSRISHLKEFLRSEDNELHYEIESFRDPGPGCYETARWFGNLIRRGSS